MPNCKNCGTRISKFDKDICPVCGYKNPLDGVESETVELTMASLNLNGAQFKDFKPHKKSVFIVLWVLFGFLGIQMFYLKHLKYAFCFLIASLLICSTLFVILYFIASQSILLSLLVPLGVLYILSLISLFILLPRLAYFKDGNGNLIK